MFDFLKRKQVVERNELAARQKREIDREERIKEYNRREWRTHDFRVYALKDGVWHFFGYDLVYISEVDLTERIVTLSGIMPNCDRVLNGLYLSGHTIAVSRGICADISRYNEDDVIFSFHSCRIVGQKIIFPKERDNNDYVTRDVQISYINNP